MAEELKTDLVKEKKKRTPEQKKKRNKKIRLIVILLLLAALAAYFVAARVMAKSAPTYVETASVTKGKIEQTVKTSGTVETENKKTYFAGIAAPIKKMELKVGDSVTKGDTLLTYDTDKLELSKKQAELSSQQANGNYSDSMQKGTDSETKLSQANADLPTLQAQIDSLNAQIDAIQPQVDAIQNKIDEKKRRMAKTGSDLQKTLLDLDQDGKEDGTGDSNYNSSESDGTEKHLEIQQAIKDNEYAQSNDQEIADWNSQITKLNEQKTDLTDQLTDVKEKKSKAESDQSAGETGKLTSGSKSALAATKETANLTSKDTISTVKEAAAGIKADFNGVVTDVKAVEGATTTAGMELFTIDDADHVKVTISVTKYDLAKIKTGQKVDITIAGNSYEGKVAQISKVATKNSNGASVVNAAISIDNPDSNIILGTEADVVIHTASADGTLIIPIEAINTDRKGSFVYVIENGIIVRKNVKTGITSDTEEEIKEGISEGDQVLTDVTSDITEGMKAASMPSDSTSAASSADVSTENSVSDTASTAVSE
ncbi:MAG: efflux RND transporter periplasmic adaptor subunit [Butyrivibrio sp.]|jgi:RND family efflux transporter MFP subunit|nr:efflux RND transporter periplasmic adaptor subunit [Butyrivibrio sp.]